MKNHEEYYSLLKHFRNVFEFKYPISIRRVKISIKEGENEKDGEATFKNGKFSIKINKFICTNRAIDALIHELAHCVLWNNNLKTEDEHCYLWGIAYSKVYREYLTWLSNYNRKKKVA